MGLTSDILFVGSWVLTIVIGEVVVRSLSRPAQRVLA
jgi:hypothetical protein